MFSKGFRLLGTGFRAGESRFQVYVRHLRAGESRLQVCVGHLRAGESGLQVCVRHLRTGESGLQVCVRHLRVGESRLQVCARHLRTGESGLQVCARHLRTGESRFPVCARHFRSGAGGFYVCAGHPAGRAAPAPRPARRPGATGPRTRIRRSRPLQPAPAERAAPFSTLQPSFSPLFHPAREPCRTRGVAMWSYPAGSIRPYSLSLYWRARRLRPRTRAASSRLVVTWVRV